MPSYTAPVEDMLFLFEKLRDNKNYNELKKYDEVSTDLVKDILEKAVQDVLNDGLRTKDIMSEGMKETSTSAMGDAIISKLQ